MRVLRMVTGAESDGIMVISAVVFNPWVNPLILFLSSQKLKSKFDLEILRRRCHPLLCMYGGMVLIMKTKMNGA
jgi:hypothetical protein